MLTPPSGPARENIPMSDNSIIYFLEVYKIFESVTLSLFKTNIEELKLDFYI